MEGVGPQGVPLKVCLTSRTFSPSLLHGCHEAALVLNALLPSMVLCFDLLGSHEYQASVSSGADVRGAHPLERQRFPASWKLRSTGCAFELILRGGGGRRKAQARAQKLISKGLSDEACGLLAQGSAGQSGVVLQSRGTVKAPSDSLCSVVLQAPP